MEASDVTQRPHRSTSTHLDVLGEKDLDPWNGSPESGAKEAVRDLETPRSFAGLFQSGTGDPEPEKEEQNMTVEQYFLQLSAFHARYAHFNKAFNDWNGIETPSSNAFCS